MKALSHRYARRQIYFSTSNIIKRKHSNTYLYLQDWCKTIKVNNRSTRSTKIWIREIDIFIQIRKRFANVHNIHTRIGIRKTRNSFRYETFIPLFEFKGFSTWGESDTISFNADFSIWTPPRAAPPTQTTGLASVSPENRLSSSKPNIHIYIYIYI